MSFTERDIQMVLVALLFTVYAIQTITKTALKCRQNKLKTCYWQVAQAKPDSR